MLDDNEFPPLPSQAHRKKKPSTAPLERVHPVASLNSLPDELILEILDYLPGIDVQHFQLLTLASLSLTSRRFHCIVSGRLYSAFSSFFCTPYPFLRTVISNPALAAHVTSMKFLYGTNVHSERSPYVPSILDKQLVKDGLKRLNIPDWKGWSSELNGPNVEQELIYATILMCVPNISKLEIDDGKISCAVRQYRFPAWLKFIRYAVSGTKFGLTHRLEHLKTIWIDLSYLKLHHLAPVFKLRSMRQVTLTGLVEWAHIKEGKPEFLRRLLPPGTSSVEELHLEKSFLHSDVFAIVISSMRRLKVLQYESSDCRFGLNGHAADHYWKTDKEDGDASYDDDLARDNYDRIAQSLRGHTSSLKTLSLREASMRYDGLGGEGAIGTLHDFGKLTNLEIPHKALAIPWNSSSLVEHLPRSIQSLAIGDIWRLGYPSARQDLENIALRCRELPALRKITTVGDLWRTAGERKRFLSENWDHVRELLLERGVHFKIDSGDKDDEDGVIQSRFIDSPSSDTSDSTSYEESLYSN